MKFLLPVLLLLTTPSLAKKVSIEVVVKNRMEEPVENASVEIAGRTVKTDESGIAYFKSIKIGKRDGMVIVDGGEDYYVMNTFLGEIKSENKLEVVIDFTLSTIARKKTEILKLYRDRLDEMIDTTDMSFYVDCDDTTGVHFNTIPEFPFGNQAFNRLVLNKIEYPEEAIINEEQGKVRMKVSILADGSISEIVILESATQLLDAEAKRVINLVPFWIPASCNGEYIDSSMTLPIVFTLQ